MVITLPAPATSKQLKDNGDGTYTLSLSVTGTTDTSSEDVVPPKANVVIVIDVSGSMTGSTSSSYWGNSTRMSDTKNAAKLLVEALLNNNKNKDGFRDIMEISLIKFANKTPVYNSGWGVRH